MGHSEYQKNLRKTKGTGPGQVHILTSLGPVFKLLEGKGKETEGKGVRPVRPHY
jgi:hypothetical protein